MQIINYNAKLAVA